jgi:hypothetical protein
LYPSSELVEGQTGAPGGQQCSPLRLAPAPTEATCPPPCPLRASPHRRLHAAMRAPELYDWLFRETRGGSSSCASPTRLGALAREYAEGILRNLAWLGLGRDSIERSRRVATSTARPPERLKAAGLLYLLETRRIEERPSPPARLSAAEWAALEAEGPQATLAIPAERTITATVFGRSAPRSPVDPLRGPRRWTARASPIPVLRALTAASLHAAFVGTNRSRVFTQ